MRGTYRPPKKEDIEKIKSGKQRINFDYQIMNPTSGGIKGEQKSKNMVLDNLLTNVHLHWQDDAHQLLVNPLTESFITLKWWKVRRASYLQFGFSLVLAVLYHIYLRHKCDYGVDCNEAMAATTNSSPEDCSSFHAMMWTLRCIIFIILIGVTLFELLLRVTYWQTALALALFSTVLVALSPHLACSNPYVRDVCALSGLISWFYIFSSARMLPKLGTKIMIFVKVAKRLTKLMFAPTNTLSPSTSILPSRLL